LPLVAILETLSGSAQSLPDPSIRRRSLRYDLESRKKAEAEEIEGDEHVGPSRGARATGEG
jgi:hypothetical protein